MDININNIDTNPAYVRRVEDEEGYIKRYGSSLNDYLAEVERPEDVEQEATPYIEVSSNSGDILTRIPEDMFTFPNDESKQAFIDATSAFLDSTKGYFEFSKMYANAASFPIPTSPRYSAEYLYKLLNEDLRPNATPVIPYVHTPKPFDPEQEPEEYFELEVATETTGVFEAYKCKIINLVNGMQICFLNSEQDEVSFIDSIEPHTIATVLLALYIINQEYPTVTQHLVKHFIEAGENFNSSEEIRVFIDDYLRETQPAVPTRKYPHQNL